MISIESTNPDKLTRDEQAEFAAQLRWQMEQVAWAGGALDLRLARLLAYFKHQDLSAIGFPSYTAFAEERVGWKSTWLRLLIRFAESNLSLVQAAVCQGALPMSVAVKAVRDVAKGEEEAKWLDAALRGRRTYRRADDDIRVDWWGPEAEVIVEARERARLLMGRPVSPAHADQFVREAWEQKLSGEALLGQARETPPAPELGSVPEWTEADPATAMLGPWKTPESLEEGLKFLARLLDERRKRVVWLGTLYTVTREGYWVWSMGFDSHAELARHLGMSLRSLQRHARVADALSIYPELDEAFREGMDLTRLEVVSTVAEGATARWVDVAKRVTVTELRRAVQWAAEEGVDTVLARYEQAMGEATNTVALREAQEKRERPAVVYSDPDQLRASRWFLDNVRIEARKGFGKVVDRDAHRCQNPRCNARNLRVQAHHVVWQRHGGSDELGNGLTLCVSCHLRLVHAGKAEVVFEGDRLLWRFADGESVTVFA